MGLLKEKLMVLSNTQICQLWQLWIQQNIALPDEKQMITELLDVVDADEVSAIELYKDIDKLKIGEDHCPKCNSTDLWYGDKTWHGDQVEQETACQNCEFEFQQWYKAKFDGVTQLDTDGSHIDIDNVMRRFEFTITLSGQGNCANGAWVDAVNSFGGDPGSPDADQIKVFEI